MGNCGEMFNFTADILHVKELIRFWGNMEAKADAKGRVFLPAVFRKQLQNASEERLIMRKDVFQDCLVLYPESVWNTDLDELRKHLNPWNSRHQQIFRQYVSDVEIVILDSNGRILIPRRYLIVTGIQNDVRFVGMDNRIEMWAKEKTEQPFMDLEDFSNALQEVMKGDNE